MPEFKPFYDDQPHPQVKWLVQEAAPCPNCKAGQSKIRVLEENGLQPRYVVSCRHCGHCGPFARNLPAAFKKWNNPPKGFLAFFKKLVTA